MVSFKKLLLSASAIASLLAIVPACAGALPASGHYVSGHGTIAKGDQSLTVKQSSTTGIINWNSFSVGRGNSITFNNGSGATLNRVTGGDLSRIAGSLHATGSLYLMNGNGMIVSGSGHIVTGGNFAASTGNITNSAFNSDDRRFKPGAGNIVNRGSIIAGGSASLTAHNITIGTRGEVDVSSAASRSVISLKASGATVVAGTLKAQGKTVGGHIETSGAHVQIGDGATISTRAANGKTGTWLIDPQDFTIAASGGDITGAELSSELANNAVTIRSSSGANAGNGDIFVDDAVSWSSTRALTLDAFHSIEINDTITATGNRGKHEARLFLEIDDGGSGGDVTQTAPIITPALALLGPGDFDLANTSNKIASLAANVASLELADTQSEGFVAAPTVYTFDGVSGITTTGGLTITTTGNFEAIDYPVTAGTSISITAGGSIESSFAGGPLTAPSIDLVAGGGVDVFAYTQTLTGSSDGNTQLEGSFQNLAGFDAAGNSLLVADDSSLNVTGTVSASTMILEESGIFCTSACTATNLTIDGKLKASQITLGANGRIGESRTSRIDANKKLTVESSGAAIDLTSTHNKVAELSQGTLAHSGNHAIQFTDDRALKALGDIGMGTGRVVLKTVGKGNDLRIGFHSTIGDGGVVTLVTSGEATEDASGEIDASTLNVTANTGIELTSTRNDILAIGTDQTDSGPNDIVQ